MSTIDVSNETAAQAPKTGSVDFKLEVAILPVSDADRAKRFYASLGWRRTPTSRSARASGSCSSRRPARRRSIIFGTGVTPAAPGAGGSLLIAVDDVEAARAELIERGADVSEVFHGRGFSDAGQGREPGPDPQRQSYGSFATFSDPDGNEFLLQEVTSRLPGAGGDGRRHARRAAARDRAAPRPLREGRPGPRLVGLVRGLPRTRASREQPRAGRRRRRPPTWRRRTAWWLPAEVRSHRGAHGPREPPPPAPLARTHDQGPAERRGLTLERL